jgi:N-acetylmuramoyl-L-alanine amidase
VPVPILVDISNPVITPVPPQTVTSLNTNFLDCANGNFDVLDSGSGLVPAKSSDSPGYIVQPADFPDKISRKTDINPSMQLPNQVDTPGGHDKNSSPEQRAQDSIQAENPVPSLAYRIRKGESLWLIGRSMGITYEEIMAANNLLDYLIYPERELLIPGLDLSNGIIKYRIKAGDTFYLIGKALGINYVDIMSLNGIADIWIYPDQELQIPGKNKDRGYKQAATGFLTAETDLEMLARAIYAEARGETYTGQVAVGAVIMNRLKNASFPKTIPDIILQPGAFSAVDDGQINFTPDSAAYRAAQDALKGIDPTLGAIYYWNPDAATSKWIWTRRVITQIGRHLFAL